MKVLIIGGTGFIGNPVTKLLFQNGHQVAVFHRNRNSSEISSGPTEIIGSRENITNFKKEFLLFKPDLVIDIIPYTAQDIWTLQMALKGIVKNLLLLSSGDVYKVYDTFHRKLTNVDNSPLTEKSELRSRLYPYKPQHFENYDELLFNYDKIVVELMIQKDLFSTNILRLPAVFGEGDKQQKLSEYIRPMLTNQSSIKLSVEKANWIWTRSYVENVAHAIYLVATNEYVKNEIFNIGDINIKEIDLVTKLKELTNWKGEVIIDNNIRDSFNYCQNIIMDNSKLKQILSYSEKIDYETALLRTIKNYG